MATKKCLVWFFFQHLTLILSVVLISVVCFSCAGDLFPKFCMAVWNQRLEFYVEADFLHRFFSTLFLEESGKERYIGLWYCVWEKFSIPLISVFYWTKQEIHFLSQRTTGATSIRNQAQLQFKFLLKPYPSLCPETLFNLQQKGLPHNSSPWPLVEGMRRGMQGRQCTLTIWMSSFGLALVFLHPWGCSTCCNKETNLWTIP